MSELQNPQARLHPELVPLVQTASNKVPPGSSKSFGQAIQARSPRIELSVSESAVVDGERTIPVRTFCPRTIAPLAAIAYFHGGGFAKGEPERHDAVARAIASETGCAVAAIDFRVLPTHQFPAAFNDAVSALRWLPGWAAKLGLNPENIAAAGDSSGANLAMAAALELSGEISLRALWLAYPFIGADFETASHRENADAPMLTRGRCQHILAEYLGRPLTPADWRAVPLLSPDLVGLPPVVAIAAELDPLRSDAEILIERMPPDSRSVLVHAAGMPHGFLRWVSDAQVCADITSESLRALQKLLSH